MVRIIRFMAAAVLAGGALGLLRSAADDKGGAMNKEKILRRFSEEFVTLTPGQDKFPAAFKMGTSGIASEEPVREVTLKPFAIARYEVTQELWEVVMGKNPSKWKGPRNSVEMMSWSEANDFCRKATDEMHKLKLLDEKESIRLPSEAEWEYACRAGTTTRYSFGDKEDDLRDYAWFKGNSKGEDPPVGRKKPNPWGLYDMHGYIWEWCQDSWAPNYEGAPKDGSARQDKDAKERVLRGGSWADEADHHRSGYRHHADAGQRSDAIGFRCVRSK